MRKKTLSHLVPMAALKGVKKEDEIYHEYSSNNAEDEDKVELEEESTSKSDFGFDAETASGLPAILPTHHQNDNGDNDGHEMIIMKGDENNDDEDDHKEEEGACNVLKYKKMVKEHKKLKQEQKIMKLEHQRYELLLKIKEIEKYIELEKLRLKYMR